jgi:hypothetical protein
MDCTKDNFCCKTVSFLVKSAFQGMTNLFKKDSLLCRAQFTYYSRGRGADGWFFFQV